MCGPALRADESPRQCPPVHVAVRPSDPERETERRSNAAYNPSLLIAKELDMMYSCHRLKLTNTNKEPRMDVTIAAALSALIAGASVHARNALLRHVDQKQAHGAAV